jgi:xylono-1,5-lactonase
LGAELGEGPAWHQDRLWFVDIKGPRVHCFTPADGTRHSWEAPAPVGFVLPVAGGGFIAGLKSGLHRFDPGTGAFTLLTTVEPAEWGNRLNDGAVDPSGHLWFGSMHDPEETASGALYRLDPDGTPRARDSGYIVTNGPAFSPDGRTLYHTDTLGQVIHAFDLDGSGAVTGKRDFVRIETPGICPDGPIVDAEGCVWTGLFGGWGVRRYAPSGELIGEIRLPCSRVTKAAFGGPDMRTLFMTTAWLGLSEAARAEEPLAGGLFSVRVDVPGLPTTVIRHGLGK